MNTCPALDATLACTLSSRFRGFLPVVVDVETGGFDCNRHALLEIAAIPLQMDDAGLLHPGSAAHAHVEPFAGSEMDPKSLEVTGIDPYNPLRGALPEQTALEQIFKAVRLAMREADCQRAVLVGHNAAFDLGFLNAAVARIGHKRNPFHPFSCLDTVALAALAYGQTVLGRAVQAAGLRWDGRQAHSALYDARITAELFCLIVNRWRALNLKDGALTPEVPHPAPLPDGSASPPTDPRPGDPPSLPDLPAPASLAAMPSFDIVSKLDPHELTNAVDQANRELEKRFDFKGSHARFERTENQITLKADTEFRLKQMQDILMQRLAARGIDIRCAEVQPPCLQLASASQTVQLKQGIDQTLGKKLLKQIKDSGLKLQAQIQGEQLRVSGKKRDDLQALIALLRAADLELPLQFENFRD